MRLRALPESTETSSRIARASETPIPAVDPAVVEPLEVVSALTSCEAEAVMLDAVSGAVLAPMEALVRMTARTMATEGVIETLPEPAPASDSVVSVDVRAWQ